MNAIITFRAPGCRRSGRRRRADARSGRPDVRRVYRRPGPAAKPRGRGVPLIFNRICPAIRTARFARRGGATGSASGRRSALAETRFLTALQQPSLYACCNAWRQPPGCPLKFASRHTCPAYAAVRLPAVSHPAAAGLRCRFGSYRSHPWRKKRLPLPEQSFHSNFNIPLTLRPVPMLRPWAIRI